MTAAPAANRHSGAGSGSGRSTVGETDRPSSLAIAGLATVVVVGVALRLHTRSALWLDEATTVHLAQLPLADLPDGLRRDGAPPLFYVLLHGWIRVVGSSDIAVRLLPAAFGVATLPLLWRVGRRLGGPVVALAAVVVLSTSPFAIRYATEVRMYTLVVLLVAIGWLVLLHALDADAGQGPRAPVLLALGGTTGLLLLTHYWAFFLAAVTALALVARAVVRPRERRNVASCLGAMVVGAAVLFGPWVPVLHFQLANTGTPWGTPPGPVAAAVTTLVDFGGGPHPEGRTLGVVLGGLALVGFTRRPRLRAPLVVAAATVLVAVVAGTFTDSAFAGRYTSVAFPLVVVGAASGSVALAPDRRVLALLLAAVALLGLAGGVRNLVSRRTSADAVASAIAERGGRPGDVVAYCPDQLGPDVTRLLPEGYRQVTYPDGADPRLVDWVDYEARMRAADPDAFARSVLRRSDGRTIWYVWMPRYRTLGTACEQVSQALAAARPGHAEVLAPDPTVFEPHLLWQYPAVAGVAP